MGRFILVLCGLLLTVTAVLAQTTDARELAADPVYQKNCAKCHGKTARGRHFGGPSLVTNKVAGMPADELRNDISNGKNRMPKFTGKLTPEQIDTLVQEINSAAKK